MTYDGSKAERSPVTIPIVQKTMTSDDVSSALEQIAATEDVGEILSFISTLLGSAYLSYQTNPSGVDPSVSPFIRSTYPSEWIKRYIQCGYFAIDPIIRNGYKRNLPFDWAEVKGSSEEEDRFFEDAKRHGLGANGLSIPLTDRDGHRGLFSINVNCRQADWPEFKASTLSDLLLIGQSLHQHVTKTIYRSVSPIKLAPREVECLHWISEGKDVPAIAIILALSEHTVRSYLKSCRLKLGCSTISQAIYKATRMDLIKSRH